MGKDETSLSRETEAYRTVLDIVSGRIEREAR
jgi:hypothetical protein